MKGYTCVNWANRAIQTCRFDPSDTDFLAHRFLRSYLRAIRYRLPDVLAAICGHNCQDTRPINPNATALDVHFNEWIDKQDFSASIRKPWLAVKMPLLASLTNPHMTLDQLRVCLEYMVLSLAMEDLTDTASSEDSKKWASFFMHLLRHPGSADEQLMYKNPMVRVMNDLSTRVMDALGPCYSSHFISSNDALVRGMVQESVDRERIHSDTDVITFTVESYIHTRRTTIGIEPVLVLGRWARGVDFPDDVLCSPLVKGMVEATIDMVFLANDIYSYKKERIAHAAQHNVVTVIILDNSIPIGDSDIQGAVDYALGLIEAARQRFYDLLAELKSSSLWEAHQEGLQIYAENMLDWAVGNVIWSLVSPRYSIYDNASTRSTGIIEFHVDY